MCKFIPFVMGCLFFMAPKQSEAQIMIEQGPSASTRDGGIYIYGLTGKENRLRYEKINGSPFLDENWRYAALFDRDGNPFGRFKVRLNAATHEIHYLDKFGNEKADNGQIARIEFDSSSLPKGRGRILSNIEPLVSSKFKGEPKYAEQLNEGYYALLKVTVRQVNKRDSLFSTQNKYFFKDNFHYFLKSGKQTFYLKRLALHELRKFIPGERLPFQRNDFSRSTMKGEDVILQHLELINKGSIPKD